MILQASEFLKNPTLIVGMTIVIVVLAGVVVALFAYIKSLVKDNKEDLKVMVQNSITTNIELTTAVKSLDQTNQKILDKVDKMFIDSEIEKRKNKSVFIQNI